MLRSDRTLNWLFVAMSGVLGVGVAGPARAGCDASAGAKVFERCSACHTADSSANMTGPSLAGVVGRVPGAAPGYRYSAAVKKLGGRWTPERLDAWLAGPQQLAPGTSMAFSGLRKPADRAAAICFLQSKSPSIAGKGGAQ